MELFWSLACRADLSRHSFSAMAEACRRTLVFGSYPLLPPIYPSHRTRNGVSAGPLRLVPRIDFYPVGAGQTRSDPVKAGQKPGLGHLLTGSGPGLVAQTSESAVSRVSKPAALARRSTKHEPRAHSGQKPNTNSESFQAIPKAFGVMSRLQNGNRVQSAK